MDIRIALVAMLLLSANVEAAAAAQDDEKPQHKSKNAAKLLIFLNSVGLNSKDVQQFVSELDERIDNGYVRLGEQEVAGGKLLLQYEIDTKITGDQLQLKYVPDNSNFEYVANPSSLMMNYKLSF